MALIASATGCATAAQSFYSALPAQQRARLVADGRRRLRIDLAEKAEREIAALEHELGIALPPRKLADAAERFILLAGVACLQERGPLPQRRIGRQLGEAGVILCLRRRNAGICLIARALQRNNGEHNRTTRPRTMPPATRTGIAALSGGMSAR